MANLKTRRTSDKSGQVVSSSGLAEILGVSVKTVHNWRNEGMPVHRKLSTNKYEFDTAKCYRWRLKYENDLIQRAVEADRKKYEAEQIANNKEMTGAEAKTRKEIANALMAELELAKAQQQVANIDDLMANFVDALVEVRAKLVSQSSRLSGILAYQEEDAIREILDSDAADTLEALSSYKHEYVGGSDD